MRTYDFGDGRPRDQLESSGYLMLVRSQPAVSASTSDIDRLTEGNHRMAQKVSFVLLCDLHDEQDVEAAETAAFGVDGSTY